MYSLTCDAHACMYASSLTLFDRLHELFATETLWWPYEVAKTSQMLMHVDPIADKKVSETFLLLSICG